MPADIESGGVFFGLEIQPILHSMGSEIDHRNLLLVTDALPIAVVPCVVFAEDDVVR